MNHLGVNTFWRTHVSLLSGIALAALVALVLSPLAARAQSAPEPIQVSGAPALVSGGPGNQTDPHISGTLVTYTNAASISSEIRYHNLATGSDAAIPNDAHRDELSDVHGSTIVFRRIYTDGSTSTRPIMTFETANPAAASVELDPVQGDRRRSPAISGDTVTWMTEAGGLTTTTDVVAYDLDSGQATWLTTDGIDNTSNRDPAVSPDGTVITWAKCQPNGTSCDIYATRENVDGTWGDAVQLSDSTSQDILPATNGQVVTYAADVGGDFDIRWKNVNGTGERQLPMPGRQSTPNISSSLISFESEAVGTTNADLFVYDLATAQLYQVTNTPDIDEMLSDISAGADGTVRMVWAQPDGLQLGYNDIYATSFELVNPVLYEVCPLFDQSRAYRLKSTVPVRFQLCDAQGQNLSSASIVVTATGLVKRDGIATSTTVEDAGNANPDDRFRYDAGLGGTGGYIYNLSTKGLSTGTWELRFTVSGDPMTYSVTFDLR